VWLLLLALSLSAAVVALSALSLVVVVDARRGFPDFQDFDEGCGTINQCRDRYLKRVILIVVSIKSSSCYADTA
jgi:hypothetical protein